MPGHDAPGSGSNRKPFQMPPGLTDMSKYATEIL
jgi:hypothetical protein